MKKLLLLHKNAALPGMVACLLTGGTVELENLPYVRDILTTRRLLSAMGIDAEVREDGTARMSAEQVGSQEAPYELVKTMRASILVLGPLLARFGRARVSLPGGCAIGSRPVNLHLMGLEKMGAACNIVHGYVEAACASLTGAHIFMDTVTVTGTENLMMAACLAQGETVLDNAACEPEVSDLAPAILNAIEGSDAFVLAAPVNFGTVTATMKRFIERTVCCGYWPWGGAPKPRRPPTKRAIIITASAAPDLMARWGTDAGRLLRRVARRLGAKQVDTLWIGLARRTPDEGLPDRPRARARTLGRRLATPAT